MLQLELQLVAMKALPSETELGMDLALTKVLDLEKDLVLHLGSH